MAIVILKYLLCFPKSYKDKFKALIHQIKMYNWIMKHEGLAYFYKFTVDFPKDVWSKRSYQP